MRDIDRYDVVFLLLEWLAGIAAIKLGVDVHIVLLVLPVGIAVPIFRHLDVTPARVRRLEAERAARAAKLDHSRVTDQRDETVVSVSGEDATRLKRVARQRRQQMDQVVADPLREAEQHAA